MNHAKVVVVDYGMGNLLSVRRALEHVGAEVYQCSDADVLSQASKVILPGVGAFGDGMAELRRLGLDKALRDLADRGIPIMGICLGMQMLFDGSEEFGDSIGLGLIPGRVISIPHYKENGVRRKIPHIGWSALFPVVESDSWSASVLESVKVKSSVYFLHSFMAVPYDQANCLAKCDYEGQLITAAVKRENISGCQFHPEKSGPVGLSILKQFLKL